MRNQIFTALILLCSWLLLCGESATAATAARPNILIILADDYGYADAGFQGCQDIPTPNIDSLAKAGVRCTSGYVSGPYCSPTRAGLLTGRYQQRFGHEFNPGGSPDLGLPVSETTLADRLKAAGYATGLVGKWHLGEAPRFHPLRRGFTEYFGFLGGAHSYFPGAGAPIYRNDQPVVEPEYLTDAFGREAVAFIDRHQAEPFFLYLAFNAVHNPLQATPGRLKQFDAIDDPTRRTYAAMTLAMDQAVGRVLDKLRASGLDENTLIFFFSDNGGPTMPGTTVNGSSNKPLRGSKRTTLEGGVRVPFVVTWKNRLEAGRVYDQPVIQLDIHATALAAAGVAVEPQWKLDGVNLLPYLTGENASPPHETLYWRFGQQTAVRQGDWKLVRYDATADGEHDRGVSPERLYNLRDDIGEANDLAGQQRDRAANLRRVWETWNEELVAPLWGGEGARRRRR